MSTGNSHFFLVEPMGRNQPPTTLHTHNCRSSEAVLDDFRDVLREWGDQRRQHDSSLQCPVVKCGCQIQFKRCAATPCIGVHIRCVFLSTIRDNKHLGAIYLKHLAIIGKVVMVSRVYGRKAHKSRTNLEALAVSCGDDVGCA